MEVRDMARGKGTDPEKEKLLDKSFREHERRKEEEIRDLADLVARAAAKVAEKREHDMELLAKAAEDVTRERLAERERDRQNILSDTTPRGTVKEVLDQDGNLRTIERR
jgi:hypothetical protein